MKREAATAWVCACKHPDVKYDQCTPQKPYRSLRRTKTAEHERAHLAHIKLHEEAMAMVQDAPRIIGAELRVGTWDDWKGILEATKLLAKFAHEHQGIYRRSFFIWSASDNLEKAVRRLLWFQTKEGKLVQGERWMKQVYKLLDAMFDDIKRRGERKRCPKRSFDVRMATAKGLVDAIAEEARLIEQKIPGADGLKEVREALKVCNHQMATELRKSHEESP